MIKIRDTLRKLNPCKHGSTNRDVLDFSTNIYPVTLPDEILAVINKTIPYLWKYPESESMELREKIADHINVSPESIIIGNGTTELIRLISFCFSGDTFIPQPTYSEYEFSSRMCGSKIFSSRIPEEDEFLINEDILKFPHDTALIFLCNPNNPTGRIIPKRLLLSFLDKIKDKNIILVLDELYYEISDSYTLIEKTMEFNNLIVLRSLTKSYGLCGLRLGYAVANEKIIEILNKVRAPWNVNIMAQNLCSTCLAHPFFDKIKKEAKKSKEMLRQKLEKFPLRVYPSEANFFLINIKDTPYNSSELTELLLSKGIYIRDCSSFRYLNENYIRIGVKTPDENEILIEKFEEVLG